MNFKVKLGEFTSAVEAGDGTALAALFTEDGVYEDGFYGAFEGREAIARMLKEHFHGAAERFQWVMYDPVSDDSAGFARYVFTYVSTMPEAKGKRVIFEGMCRFEFEDGLIKRYSEVFDRGAALAQLEFHDARIVKSLRRWTKKLTQSPRVRERLQLDD